MDWVASGSMHVLPIIQFLLPARHKQPAGPTTALRFHVHLSVCASALIMCTVSMCVQYPSRRTRSLHGLMAYFICRPSYSKLAQFVLLRWQKVVGRQPYNTVFGCKTVVSAQFLDETAFYSPYTAAFPCILD